MSNLQKTTFGTIFDDVKASLKGAWNNVLSYFLANLGMLIVALVLLAVIAIPIIAVLLLAGPAALTAWAEGLVDLAFTNPWAISLGAYLILLPFLAVLFLVIGSIYGMSKEVVETGKTSAESAFSWLRHNFLTFAGVGFIVSLIVIVPQLLVVATAVYLLGPGITPLWASYGMTVFVFAYSFITLGLTSMVFPAVVNGKGIQEAVYESFKLATQRFDRVFGVHTAIVLLALLTISPFLAYAAIAMVVPIGPLLFPGGMALGLYAMVIGLFWLLVFLPATFIAYVRVYTDLTGGEVSELSAPAAEVPMV